MTTAPLLEPPTQLHDPPSDTARITFREPVTAAGFIDAAWWPTTLDLTAELPPLLEVLWATGREINRVTFNLAAWHAAPRRMRIEGRTVRLGGFATSDPLTVRLSDAWGRERIDVLVIAPSTDPAVAQRALRLAGRADDPYRADEILARANDATASDLGGQS
jgi:hypothetical protein